MTRTDRLSTLYLHANGFGSRVVWADTVLRGLLGYRDGAQPPRPLRRFRKVRALFRELQDIYAPLCYIADWRDAFLRSPALDVHVCNINNLGHYARCLLCIRDYDLIVISHAAAGDDMTILRRSAAAFHRRRGPIALFIGNEYALLEDKIAFIRDVQVDHVCSQLPLAAARYLYGEAAGDRIVEMPHALNPHSFHRLPDRPRTIDVGFIGDIYWPFIGDRERTDFIEWFERHGAASGLSCDIRRRRIGREAWNLFLNDCRAIVGAESNTYYLNERGRLLERARAYNIAHPDAAFETVFDLFFRDQPRGVSGKCLSSRHFEPIGTQTVQVLLEGAYNGILEAGVHYIPVKKDLSDLSGAIERLKDADYCSRLAADTFDYAMASHTHDHRVARLVSLLS
jgi:hypothetical protein